MADKTAAVQTIEQLIASSSGGTVILNIAAEIRPKVERTYRGAIEQLDQYRFWRNGTRSAYRPTRGLWVPQRRAVAFAHAYLSVRQQKELDSTTEAALIKMPTGTGKTAVIAVLACGSPFVRK